MWVRATFKSPYILNGLFQLFSNVLMVHIESHLYKFRANWIKIRGYAIYWIKQSRFECKRWTLAHGNHIHYII